MGVVSGKTGIVASTFLFLFLVERLYPAELQLNDMARLLKNAALAIINAMLSPLVTIPLSMAASGWAWPWRPEWLAGSGGMIFDMVLLDAWIYVWHRANHQLPFLWRFHEVHHLDETLDTTTAVRFHFGEVLLSSLARTAVIVALAVPLTSVIVFETCLVLATLFHHSNLRLSAKVEAALARVIVTPSIHWVHHHARQSDTDSNYATILSLWDRLFASASTTCRTPEMKLGVEGAHDAPFPQLVIRPFKRPA